MIKRLLQSEFGRGAIILFICMNVFNLLNLVFNFFSGRMLGPEQYGILATLMSFISLYGIPSEVIQNIVSKYTTKFSKEESKIKYVFSIFLKNSFILAIVLFVILAIISIPLSEKLGINYWLMVMTHLLIFTTFLSPIPRGILQGKKKFAKIGIPPLIEGITKLFIAVILIYFGLEVFGAMQAVLFSAVISMGIYFYFCKDIIRLRKEKTSLDSIKFGPYFVLMWTLMIFISLDIILAKYFLPSEIAGKYAAISLIGKIIYMGTNSITRVMFPIVSEKFENKQNTKEIFLKSINLTLIFGLIGIIFYITIPKIIILVLYGSQYLDASKYIIYSGIAFLILSLTNINFMYCLSTNKLKSYWVVILGIFIQILLFSLMHDSLGLFLGALVISNIAMFILSFLLFRK